jgi:PAS domain-containing protein
VEALAESLAGMPANTGMAFVVVTHRHPGHSTLLPELLANCTNLPVVEATDGLRVEPNHVYVGTPGGQLAILNGLLHRLETGRKEAPHLPIDYFLRSLAQDRREKAFCIILSGTGNCLEPSAGQPRLNVLDMAREGLQVPLTSALRPAASQTGTVPRENVRVRTNGSDTHVNVSVMQIQEPETVRGLLLVDLSRANDDMQNLLNSTEVATIFLDNDLNIKRYTEQARRLIKFIQSDLGRPLADLASSLNYDSLVPDCGEVLRTLVFKQTEVRTNESWWYLMRIMPYRTAENVIDGLVLTFVDINPVKKAEQELAAAKERLAFDLETMTRLHRIGTLFVRKGSLDEILDEVLETAVFITRADLGNLQLLDPASRRLRIRAQRGFKKPWLEFWNNVDPARGTCGTALKKGERVIVEDITQSPRFADAPELDVQLKAGVRAVQSTPLINGHDKLIHELQVHQVELEMQNEELQRAQVELTQSPRSCGRPRRRPRWPTPPRACSWRTCRTRFARR